MLYVYIVVNTCIYSRHLAPPRTPKPFSQTDEEQATSQLPHFRPAHKQSWRSAFENSTSYKEGRQKQASVVGFSGGSLRVHSGCGLNSGPGVLSGQDSLEEGIVCTRAVRMLETPITYAPSHSRLLVARPEHGSLTMW